LGAQGQGANATGQRWLTINRTLILITNGDHVLLMKRALTRRVFPGYYNGVGGHIERHEDPFTCALREIREETGLRVHGVRLRGVYNIDTGEANGILLFIFTAESETRDVIPCDEGTLEWIPLHAVGQLNLVEDLPHIWPRLFGETASERPFFAHVSYDENDQIVMRFAGSGEAGEGRG
jgi:8-oxo-dGTP diphosphatase